LLTSARLPAVVLNVTGCRWIDLDGISILVDSYRRASTFGCDFAIATEPTVMGRMLWRLGIDQIVPVFPSEAAATLALRDGAASGSTGLPLPHSEAPGEVLVMWRWVLAVLEERPGADVTRWMSSTHSLCQQAEDILRIQSMGNDSNCYLCSLFHALGTRAEEAGCEGKSRPMLDALLQGNRMSARAQVARFISFIETLPLIQA
jgi:hypothetical protein